MTTKRTRRLLAAAALGLVLLLTACGHYYFRNSRSVGKGPAGREVPHTAFSRIGSGEPVLLIGLGDSVTAGFGARKGYSYFDRMITNPPDEHSDMRGISLSAVFPNLRSTNLSVSGSTSIEHARQQIPRLAGLNTNFPALIVFTTGGNDLIHNYGRTPPREAAMYGATWDQAQPWIRNFEQRLDSMISEIFRIFPDKSHVFLANIYDPTDGVGDIARAGLPPWPDGLRILAAYNAIIQRCADTHTSVHLVDIHREFLGHGIHCGEFWSPHYDSKDPHYWYYVNLEDPNERGYDALRRLFLSRMSDVLAVASPTLSPR